MPQSPKRYGRWTAQSKRRFLDRLAAGDNVVAAAATCGMTRFAAYKLRRREPAFAQGWAAAVAPRPEPMHPDVARRLAQAPRTAAEARFHELLRLVHSGAESDSSFATSLSI